LDEAIGFALVLEEPSNIEKGSSCCFISGVILEGYTLRMWTGLFASIAGLGQYVHVGLTSGAVKKCLPVNVVQNILSFLFVLQEQLRKGKRNVEIQISWEEWWSESGCWYFGRKLVCKEDPFKRVLSMWRVPHFTFSSTS
jgi:hypothetical protein